MKKILLVVALLAGVFSSCGDEEVVLDPLKTGQAYYPLDLGTYWIYNVTETSYTNNVGKNTSFQTRELVKTLSKDQTGKEWYMVEVSKRETSSGSWVVTGVKAISKTVNDVQVQENNRTNVLMVFPVAEGKEWNPNAYNKEYNFQEDLINQFKYRYQDVGLPFEKSGKKYNYTTQIVKKENTNLSKKDAQFEILALEVGPVFRSSKILKYCEGGTGSNCEFGEGFIESGLERMEELDSTGKI